MNMEDYQAPSTTVIEDQTLNYLIVMADSQIIGIMDAESQIQNYPTPTADCQKIYITEIKDLIQNYRTATDVPPVIETMEYLNQSQNCPISMVGCPSS